MLKFTNSKSTRTSELEEFFFRCVDTVRKDIVKRNGAEFTYKAEEIDYSAFKIMDCIKVLSMFVANDRIQTIIYN